MKQTTPVFAFLLVAPWAYAAAGSDMDRLLSMSLEDLMATKVSISTTTRQPLAKAPSVVSVITAEDIKATGAMNVTDILQSIPGIYVRANLFAFRPQVTFRGASSTHTLLMVDGEPIRDLVWSSGIYWKGLPTSMVDRIEIIRGPGSALFGSDASAGVINIITKAAVGVNRNEAGARAGSFRTGEGWAQYGGNWGGVDVAMTAQLGTTAGHAPRIPSDGQTAMDARTGSRISLAPGNADYGYDTQDVRFSAAIENWRLLAGYTHHGDLAVGLTGAGVLDPNTRGTDSRSDLALLYNNEAAADHWGIAGEVRYYELDYSSGNGYYERPAGYVNSRQYSGAANGAYPLGWINRNNAAQRGYSAEASGLFTGLKTHAIKIGAGYKLDDLYYVQQLVNFGTGPNGAQLPAGGPLVDISGSPYAAPARARRIRYAFVQDVWTIANDWELTAGARYDHYSDFGGAVDPRVALVWQTADQLVTKLMYGRAFRAPSYLELYTFTAASLPNPELKPERSDTWDLQFSYSVSRDLKLGIDFYRFAQSNLIAVDPANNYRFANMGDNMAHGVEFEAQWQATPTLRIAANASSRRETLLYNSVPKQKSYLRADWAFMPKWNWDIEADHVGKRRGSLTRPVDAYTVVDSTWRYAYSREWEFAFSVRNLFNADAYEYSSSIPAPYNLPLPKRNAYAEARYRF